MSFKVSRFPETRKTQKTLETLKPNGQFADVCPLFCVCRLIHCKHLFILAEGLIPIVSKILY